jgi:hypothetical protein
MLLARPRAPLRTWFLGIRVIRDRTLGKLWLCQDSYIEKITSRYKLQFKMLPIASRRAFVSLVVRSLLSYLRMPVLQLQGGPFLRMDL